jgi:ribosome-binding protein aMBF1 (putative translation factor)
MAVITKKTERVVVDDAQIVVCDGCGRESEKASKYCNTQDGWYLIARVPGDRKEACSQACAIAVIASLQRA